MPDAHEPGLAAANERLLVRLGFDLHGGPLQQVYVLAQDVRLLREQMVGLVGEQAPEDGARPLRRPRSSTRRAPSGSPRPGALAPEPRSLLQQPLPEAVGRAWRLSNGERVSPPPSCGRDPSEALHRLPEDRALRVLQEALSNIRHHSGSREVAVILRDESFKGVCMEICDDGRGFDPADVVPAEDERAASAWWACAAPSAARRRLEIESAPGGPTTVRATLPHWLPLANQPEEGFAPDHPLG